MQQTSLVLGSRKKAQFWSSITDLVELHNLRTTQTGRLLLSPHLSCSSSKLHSRQRVLCLPHLVVERAQFVVSGRVVAAKLGGRTDVADRLEVVALRDVALRAQLPQVRVPRTRLKRQPSVLKPNECPNESRQKISTQLIRRLVVRQLRQKKCVDPTVIGPQT